MKKKYFNKRIMMQYNLQFFAKEGAGGEKTEKPTAKRKQEARDDGQVAKSNEISTAFLLIIIFYGFKFFLPYCYEKLLQIFYYYYSLFQMKEEFNNIQYVSKLTAGVFKNILFISIPMLVATFMIGIISNLLQVGWYPTLKPLKPKFNRLNPINGMKNLFSPKSLVELIKSLLKIGIIGIIIYSRAIKEKDKLLLLYNLSVLEIVQLMWNIAIDIGLWVGIFYIIIAVGDYAFHRYEHRKNLMMTKKEIKEEYKMQEGNPEIKGKIKQKMREVSMRRMMQDLPQADVVITNPTHFAVAVKYDAETSAAPLVIAKGTDYLATRIKKIAADNNIEIVENKPLARSIYYTVDIGEEIPPELYQAVAEILAFVYSLKKKLKGLKEGVRA